MLIMHRNLLVSLWILELNQTFLKRLILIRNLDTLKLNFRSSGAKQEELILIKVLVRTHFYSNNSILKANWIS